MWPKACMKGLGLIRDDQLHIYVISFIESRIWCAAVTLMSLLKIGRHHLLAADAGDKDPPWNLFALSL